MLHSICQQIWKTQQWPQHWKRSVFMSIPNKANAKECSDYPTIALISHGIKVMLKILQVRLQQYMNPELRYVQANLEKAEEPEIYQHLLDHRKSKRIPEKTPTSASLTTLKLLTMWITTNCGKLFKRWEYHTTLPAS